MKLKYLSILLPLIICSCGGNKGSSFNSSSTSSSSYQDISSSNQGTSSLSSAGLPRYTVSVTDAMGGYSTPLIDNVHELNLSTTYVLKLQTTQIREYISYEEFSFSFDNNYLEVIKCISNEDNSRTLVWQVKPLKVVESTSIDVYHREALYSSYSLSIKDLSVNASTCATTEQEIDSMSSIYPEEVTVFTDLDTYETYMNTHHFFSYIKNAPNVLLFKEYEYALIRIDAYRLGSGAQLSGVFTQNGNLYYDFKSSKKYFEGFRDIDLWTIQNCYLALIRYPSGIVRPKQRIVLLSYDYTLED